MELSEIKALAELMAESGLVELEVERGEDRVLLRMPEAEAPVAAPAIAPAAAQPAAAPAPPPAEEGEVLAAPLVGCVYLAPSPGAKPFVQQGASVKKGQVLCIVEAMKVMNEYTAPRDGVVAAICVENEELVEYGQPLFRLK